jgi:hypothetical protein
MKIVKRGDFNTSQPHYQINSSDASGRGGTKLVHAKKSKTKINPKSFWHRMPSDILLFYTLFPIQGTVACIRQGYKHGKFFA